MITVQFPDQKYLTAAGINHWNEVAGMVNVLGLRGAAAARAIRLNNPSTFTLKIERNGRNLEVRRPDGAVIVIFENVWSGS